MGVVRIMIHILFWIVLLYSSTTKLSVNVCPTRNNKVDHKLTEKILKVFVMFILASFNLLFWQCFGDFRFVLHLRSPRKNHAPLVARSIDQTRERLNHADVTTVRLLRASLAGGGAVGVSCLVLPA